VLAARYTTGTPLAFTRSMLWDMEARKAAHPGTYLPYVVQAGSDRSWNRHHGDGGEYLDRCSIQRQWLRPDQYQLVLERAFLNHGEQKVTFLGVPELPGPDGTLLHAGARQPLFHVEHAVGGTEARPLNRWRIVHLTQAVDHRLTAVFRAHGRQPLAGRAHRALHPRQPWHRPEPEHRLAPAVRQQHAACQADRPTTVRPTADKIKA
jgi:hypothetical protein